MIRPSCSDVIVRIVWRFVVDTIVQWRCCVEDGQFNFVAMQSACIMRVIFVHDRADTVVFRHVDVSETVLHWIVVSYVVDVFSQVQCWCSALFWTSQLPHHRSMEAACASIVLWINPYVSICTVINAWFWSYVSQGKLDGPYLTLNYDT